MPQAFLDHVSTLTFVERNNVIRSMTRKARVQFTPTEIPRGLDTDPNPTYTVLSTALTVVPAAFSTLAAEGYDALVLVERTPTLLDDPGWVDVVLKYEHVLEGPNQQLFGGAIGPNAQPPLLYGRGRSSIVEKTTNFYYPYGNPNNGKVLILTAHTYGPNTPALAGQFTDPILGPLFTIIQGGEVTIPFPQSNFSLRGWLKTTNPQSIANSFIAKINSVPWQLKPALSWICSEVQWEVLDPAAHTYNFMFEFQFNIDTWNPTVAFNDSRTGRPPAGILPPTINDPNLPAGVNVLSYRTNELSAIAGPPVPQPAGVWTVPALQSIDFNQAFAAIFEGNLPGGIQ